VHADPRGLHDRAPGAQRHVQRGLSLRIQRIQAGPDRGRHRPRDRSLHHLANVAGAKGHIPTDRIDGIDQTAVLLKGDTYSRRDYVYIYTGPILAATVKGRYKRVWVGEKPGLSGAAFFDLYNDARELKGNMLPMFPAKGMFNMMKARHELWMEKYPKTREERDWPLTGIANARPETLAAGRPLVGGRVQTALRSQGAHQAAAELGRRRVRTSRVKATAMAQELFEALLRCSPGDPT
jgi:hypothetical protein